MSHVTFEPRLFAAKSYSDSVRFRSSSGGVFYELCAVVIASGGVVYGCGFDDELSAAHVRCETLEQCERCMGSKYSQSKMGETLRVLMSDLRNGNLVLFSGTPCQVAVAQKLAGDSDRFIGVEVICHGVPSPQLFQRQLALLRKRRGKGVVAYSHRAKECGWRHVEKITYDDGSIEFDTPLADSWRHLFYSDTVLRPSCYQCPFATLKRYADITLGDYWGIEATSVSTFKDDLGVSAVIVNTEKGRNLFARTKVERVATTIEDIAAENPRLLRPSSRPDVSSDVWREFSSIDYESVMVRRKYLQSPIRYFAAMMKRTAKKLWKRR